MTCLPINESNLYSLGEPLNSCSLVNGDHKAEVLNHEPLTDPCKTESHWLSRVAILLVMLFGMNILVYLLLSVLI